jgi:phosphatidylglycerol:prolipoprotein diacylglycerol transferase
MYGAAIALTAGTTAATTGLPYFHMGEWNLGIPIQAFGVIVAAGVLIGAALLRRYAEWHGVEDDHIRGLLGWVTIAGFLGAHIFDVLFYEPQKLNEPIGTWPTKWPVLLRIWDGISSYGGFVGGAIGFALYVWWKRLPVRLMADITIVGLLPAFSIGRIGCTVVSDHVGSAVSSDKWYAFLAMDYPYEAGSPGNLKPIADLADKARRAGEQVGNVIPAWNLGLIELLYLIPVNALILWLAFRKKRTPAGFIVVLTGVLYAPVRFFLDFLRPKTTDPTHLGFTFAQWASIAAFGAAVYAASRVLRNGLPADVVATTAGEAQRQLRSLLKEEEERAEREKEDQEAEERAEKARKLAEDLEAKEEESEESDEAEEPAAANDDDTSAAADDDGKPAKADAKPAKADDKPAADEAAAAPDDDDADDEAKPAAKPAPKQGGGGKSKNKKKNRR